MRIVSTLGLAVLAVAPLAACSAIGDALIQNYEVGQCLDYDAIGDDSGEQVNSLPVVECSELHDAEVYAVFDSELEAFDFDAVEAEAQEGCYEAFEGYVGLPYEESVIYYTLLQPSDAGWNLGDREIVCLLTSGNETGDTGSFKDAGI